MGSVARAREWAWKAALAVGTAAVALYYFVPSQSFQYILYVGFGVGSAALILAGLRLQRPAARLPWLFLCAYCLLSSAGDGIENLLYGMILNRPVPLPSIADIFYLAGYPFLFVGISRLSRRPGERGLRENYADAAIVSIAALALSWHFLMGSYAHDNSVSALGRITEVAYPTMDLGMLFIILRSFVFGGSRLAYHRILTVALVLAFVADSIYDVLVLYSTYNVGNVIDAGWLYNYLLIGVAALHPSVTKPLPAPVEAPEARRRIPVLALAGGVAPGILLIGSEMGASLDVAVISGTSIAVFCLITLRMSWLFERVRSQTLQAQLDSAALAAALETQQGLEADLRHQAFHDPLTGLANRTLLHQELELAIAASATGGHQMALCFCDLDGFKAVNDTLGHDCGDDLLKTLADRLERIVPTTATVARLGGDEFAVLLVGVDAAGAGDVAARMVAELGLPVDLAGHRIAVSASVGLTFGGTGASVERVLREADTAMYEAKRRGKSRWQAFEESMHSAALDRFEVTGRFAGSIERREFFLEYQPQFSLADRRLEGFEALVRWQHPEKGRLAPNDFIPIAEETGFVVALGRWVLKEACAQLALWSAGRRETITMSVNMSGRHLEDDGLLDDVRDALGCGIDPTLLILEITESSLVFDSAQSSAALGGLRDLGVQLALDDFGTGFSSLAYLKRLPLDIVKIDKSFVDALCEPGPGGVAMIRTVVGFADALNLRTVAEGTETQDQLSQLTQLGCGSAQGFALARPMHPEEAWALLNGDRSRHPVDAGQW